jgi:hypothetical protein
MNLAKRRKKGDEVEDDKETSSPGKDSLGRKKR